MKETDIHRAAQILLDCRLNGETVSELPVSCRPHNEVEAYLVQDVLHDYISGTSFGPVVGHKIGCTTPVMQNFLGINNPCAGSVLASTAQIQDGNFVHRNYSHVGVECEIAVRLDAALGGEGAFYDAKAVSQSVVEVMAAIEIVDDRYEDYKSLGPPTLIADDFFDAGCVLGEAGENWQSLDLENAAGLMRINGTEVGRGKGWDIMEHPMNALAWLANLFSSRGKYLESGQFVLLGSVVETKWVAEGDTVEIEIEGLGGATAKFC